MDWILIARIIAQEGLPLAQALYAKWKAGTPPTDADWAELKALANQTASDRARARLTAAGISLTDPRAIEILNLIGQ